MLFYFACEAAGASCARHSLRPLSLGETFMHNSGASRRENVEVCVIYARGSFCTRVFIPPPSSCRLRGEGGTSCAQRYDVSGGGPVRQSASSHHPHPGLRFAVADPPPQAPGLSHMAEGFHEEGIVPAGAFDFAPYGCGVGVGSQDVEGEPAQNGEVLGSIVLPRPIAILGEMDVKHPMELVLDGPVTAGDVQQPLRRHV